MTDVDAKKLTTDRGQNYGHPSEQFDCAEKMFTSWRSRRRNANGITFPPQLTRKQERAVRHAVYMICTKLSRAASNPKHADSWDDVAGYARCAKMALGLEE